jgi:threonine/homoserine/homoserine lactone efflux protein
MGAVIGDLIPLAVGVAISPISIIAVILMLFAPNATRTSAGFVVGWVVGIVVATVVFILIGSAVGVGGSGSQPSTGASWIKLIVGVGLFILGLREWRHRPAPGKGDDLPGWMSAIDKLNATKATGVGFGLATVNPKNLAVTIAAGVAIADGHLSVGQEVVAVAVFTVIAVSTVVGPAIAYWAAAARMREPLDRLKTWLAAHNADVMGTVLVVIGAVLVGKGIGGLL